MNTTRRIVTPSTACAVALIVLIVGLRTVSSEVSAESSRLAIEHAADRPTLERAQQLFYNGDYDGAAALSGQLCEPDADNVDACECRCVNTKYPKPSPRRGHSRATFRRTSRCERSLPPRHSRPRRIAIEWPDRPRATCDNGVVLMAKAKARRVQPRTQQAAFDAQAFLESAGAARRVVTYPKGKTIFVQGEPSDAVM